MLVLISSSVEVPCSHQFIIRCTIICRKKVVKYRRNFKPEEKVWRGKLEENVLKEMRDKIALELIERPAFLLRIVINARSVRLSDELMEDLTISTPCTRIIRNRSTVLHQLIQESTSKLLFNIEEALNSGSGKLILVSKISFRYQDYLLSRLVV